MDIEGEGDDMARLMMMDSSSFSSEFFSLTDPDPTNASTIRGDSTFFNRKNLDRWEGSVLVVLVVVVLLVLS